VGAGSVSEQLIILSGIPGTGKSTYSHWLHECYDFTHHDVDVMGLPSDSLLDSRRLVVDWGFPAIEPRLTTCLALIGTWTDLGAELWWFDGDREAALQSFLYRGTVPRSAWNVQMRGIVENWERISKVVGERVVDVIRQTDRLSNHAIFEQMFPSGLE